MSEQVLTSRKLLLITEYDLLSSSLYKVIKDIFSDTVVFSGDDEWMTELHIHSLIFEELNNYNFEYIIYILNDDSSNDDIRKNISLVKSLTVTNKAKTILVIKSGEYDNKQLDKVIEELVDDETVLASAIFVGDILGEEIKDKKLATLVNTVGKNLGIEKAEYNLPIPVEKASDQIIKKLFSLSAYGKRYLIASKPLSSERMEKLLEKIAPNIAIQETNLSQNETVKSTNKIDEKVLIQVNEEDILRKLMAKVSKVSLKNNKRKKMSSKLNGQENLSNNRLNDKDQKNKQSKFVGALLKRTAGLRKHIWLFLVVIVVLLLLPIMLTVFSIFLFKTSLYLYSSNEVFFASRVSQVSERSSAVASVYSHILSKTPAIGSFYKDVREVAVVMSHLYNIDNQALEILLIVENVFDDTLNNRSFDIEERSSTAAVELQYLYEKTGFLLGEIEGSGRLTKVVLNRIVSYSQLTELRGRLLSYKTFMSEYPEITGSEKSKTYLILIEEGNLLMPGGGRIVAFGIIKFTGGRLEATNFYTSDYADERLKGIVEPPIALKNYFDLDNWDLKHSNWEVDFPTSAQQAEWFIDKELAIPVDGVVALDANVIKEQLGTEDSVENYTDIDSNQPLYTKMGEDFIKKLKNLKEKQRIIFLKEIVEKLNRKKIVAFVHNKNVEAELHELNWDGSFIIEEDCGKNCLFDQIGVFEALKPESSYETEKEVDLSTSLEEGIVKRRLTVFIENKNDKMNYSGYLQIVTSADAGFGNIEQVDAQSKKLLTPEVVGKRGMKQAGLFVEVEPGQTKAFIFSWESAGNLIMKENGEYKLKIIKQPLLSGYPVELSVQIPGRTKIVDSEPFSLTADGEYSYNYQLLQDRTVSFSW